MSARIALPRILRIGGGAFKETGHLIRSLGLHTPLIVTDGFFAKQGLAHQLLEILKQSGIGVVDIFSGSVPDPTTSSLDAGLQALKNGAFDCVVGLGGGSSIDTAKAIAVLGAHGGEMRDYKAARKCFASDSLICRRRRLLITS
jgi:alcohol dehydrogenase class IV